MSARTVKPLRRCGLDWVRTCEDWQAVHRGRYTLRTWPFGSIHQATVQVAYKYKGAKQAFVHIGLEAQPTRDKAMRRAFDWVEQYVVEGPPSVEKVFAECFSTWKTLYRRRSDVINHIYFVIGNGYDWLDGAIICDSPDSRPPAVPEDGMDEYAVATLEHCPEDMRATMRKSFARRAQEERDLPIGPLPEIEGVQRFYPISQEYSAICLVPDDVRPDWLLLSYEAARLLRDTNDPNGDNGSGRNNEIGRRIVLELETRFPQLCDHMVKTEG